MLYFLRKNYPKATVNMIKPFHPLYISLSSTCSDTPGKANYKTRNELFPQHSRDLTTSHTSVSAGPDWG